MAQLGEQVINDCKLEGSNPAASDIRWKWQILDTLQWWGWEYKCLMILSLKVKTQLLLTLDVIGFKNCITSQVAMVQLVEQVIYNCKLWGSNITGIRWKWQILD
jgi:hypothetical protein